MKFINQLVKSHALKEESDSDSKSVAADWKKGVNQVQQMYMAQQYRQNNGLDSEEDVSSIDDDQLKSLKKKAKKTQKNLKKN